MSEKKVSINGKRYTQDGAYMKYRNYRVLSNKIETAIKNISSKLEGAQEYLDKYQRNYYNGDFGASYGEEVEIYKSSADSEYSRLSSEVDYIQSVISDLNTVKEESDSMAEEFLKGYMKFVYED